jgi:mono/diheme cytochrome c family protein
MKQSLVFLFSILLLTTACKNEEKKELLADLSVINDNVSTISEGYDLLKTKCYACHNPTASSHDNIIAPPMAAVKMRYSRQFKSKESFVNAIAEWAINPEADQAKMRGAVAQFNVMPKQGFKEEDIRKIAIYMYENKLEQPEWFAVHEKEMHKGNRRGGMGMGKKN